MKSHSFVAELEDYDRYASLAVCIEVNGIKHRQAVTVCRLASDAVVQEAMALALEGLAAWIRMTSKKPARQRPNSKALLCT